MLQKTPSEPQGGNPFRGLLWLIVIVVGVLTLFCGVDPLNREWNW